MSWSAIFAVLLSCAGGRALADGHPFIAGALVICAVLFAGLNGRTSRP